MPPRAHHANNNRDGTDPRNALIATIMPFTDVCRPRYFLLENVRGFINIDRGQNEKVFVKFLRRCLTELAINAGSGFFKPANRGPSKSAPILVPSTVFVKERSDGAIAHTIIQWFEHRKWGAVLNQRTSIIQGRFVMVMTGKLITSREAKRHQDRDREMNYIFYLKCSIEGYTPTYAVDAF
ncbi:hypothetical protein BGX33_007851 [Mortierella sp. NVP41]|nr:hypothetical protein BGX33_007851 [Mortierella sp. NVP41]